ncbi:hypothetical protein IFR04_011433 [Cadophora malorum]|uniref:Uncharacterized protein n=1 Tax=Cadophora malorum TaxID=108018 RepID=A0A8H7W933_9HELO|nr:hypothetical protein IFR04_011433 [Cadophora malorum]
MARVTKNTSSRKRATATKSKKPAAIKKWPITFLHGHRFVKRVDLIGVFWLGWAFRTWEPVSQLKKDIPEEVTEYLKEVS